MSKVRKTQPLPTISYIRREPRTTEIETDLLRLQKEASNLQQVVSKNPDRKKRFAIYKNGNSTKWVVIEDGKKTVISKKDVALAEKTARLAWCKARLREVNIEITACRRYLNCFRSKESHLQQLLTHADFRKLVGTTDEAVEKWLNEPFESNSFHPEQKILRTRSGLLVRSKSELAIATLLEEYCLPFRYECRLDTSAGACYPDFMIMDPKTCRIYIWEHFGLMDDAEYETKTYQKIHLYRQEGYFPGDNLIMTFEDADHHVDIHTVDVLLREKFNLE